MVYFRGLYREGDWLVALDHQVYYLKQSGPGSTSSSIRESDESVRHGPLASWTEHDQLCGVDPRAAYWVLLHVELTPRECGGVDSGPLQTRAAVPPDPPAISVRVTGWEERRDLHARIGSLVSRKDR